MFLLYGSVELFIPYSNSLKDKRKIINSLIDRLRKRINISICEVAYNDLWQRTVLGFALVSSNNNDLERFITYIDDTLGNYSYDIEITHFDYKIITPEK